MPEPFQGTFSLWPVVTHLGSSSLLLPIVGIAAIGLWRAGQRAAVCAWLVALTVTTAITLATKIAFIGWGIGIATLDFTGISGHTLAATSVLPVLFGWLLAHQDERFRPPGVLFGLAIGAAVAISRVALGAHSSSEVVIAWLAGLIVCGVGLRALVEGGGQPPSFARLSPLALLLSLSTTTSTYLPTHEWEIRIALFLSGHDAPRAHRQLKRHLQPAARFHDPCCGAIQIHAARPLDQHHA